MNKLYISYNIRYSEKNKTLIKDLINDITDRILKDELYIKTVSTEKRKINNKPKIRKAVKILLLNIVFSVQVKKELIISLNDHVLYKNDISPKIFRFIIEWFKINNYIKESKGSFSKSAIYSKRTTVKATQNLYEYIVLNIFDIQLRKVVKITERIADKANKFFIVTFTDEDNKKYVYKTQDKAKAREILLFTNKVWEIVINKDDEIKDLTPIK